MAVKRRAKKKVPARRYSVYVVRLSDDALTSRRLVKKNPLYKAGKPCVYVGMTSKSPEERLAQHRAGVKSGYGYVTKYGKYLMRRQFEHLNPMSYDQAMDMERELARRLRNKGWAVWFN